MRAESNRRLPHADRLPNRAHAAATRESGDASRLAAEGGARAKARLLAVIRDAYRYVRTGRHASLPDMGRPWRIWDLDAELRYRPVRDALPPMDLPICEVGSGRAGIAAWTPRAVIGVDPGDDDRHGVGLVPPNMTRLRGDGAHLPLHDLSASAAIAVDTFEHIPPARRQAVVDEMKRVTAPGGRVIIIGPASSEAADADLRLLGRWRQRDPDNPVVGWLAEHVENGLPSVAELVELLGHERVTAVRTTGVFNIRLWWLMHRRAMNDFPHVRGSHRVHHLAWGVVGTAARHSSRGPFYRHMVVADIGSPV
jgi:SAM-dependent methyltransferase